MKKIVIGIIVLAAIIGGVFTVKSMCRVGQGEVGVVYSMKDGVQEETDKVKAESAAAVAIEKAKGQAESNRLVSESLTPELIQMKEAEARLKHGWVTVQGADAVVTE